MTYEKLLADIRKEMKIEYLPCGFSYIKVTDELCHAWNGLGLCDTCNTYFKEGYLVFILGSCICEDCFKDWKPTPTPEDLQYEKTYAKDWYNSHIELVATNIYNYLEWRC